MFSIGKLSALTGVKIPTIRYYEKIALLSSPARSSGNQRLFSERDRARVQFIKHARDLGLSIDAIRQLLRLSDNPRRSCVDADLIANSHLNEVRARISMLQSLEKELIRMVACSSETVGDCEVIRSLADHDLCQHHQTA